MLHLTTPLPKPPYNQSHPQQPSQRHNSPTPNPHMQFPNPQPQPKHLNFTIFPKTKTSLHIQPSP